MTAVTLVPGEQSVLSALPSFASPEELQAFTKGKIKSGEPRVAPALEAVSAEIRREAGWHVWPLLKDHELVLDGSGGSVQHVPTLRLAALKLASNAGVIVPPANVDVSQLGLLKIQGGQQWTSRYGQVRLIVDHGWEDAPELKALCLALTARGLSSPLGATREQAGSLSVNWSLSAGTAGGILPNSQEMATIRRYKTVEA